jgi:uncharacterized membrane protein YgdD (TMEM256/DUF423 family)
MSRPDFHDIDARARWLAAAGSVLAAATVALSAYATHAAHGEARSFLYIAAVLGFGHGVALAALAPRASGRLQFIALCGLLLGAVLFSGSLTLRYVFEMPVRVAAIGGSVLVLSWLLHAVATLRR